MHRTLLTIAITASILFASNADAQVRENSDNTFSWSGSVPSGRSIVIRNVIGPVRVEHSGSGKVEVTAEKRWRRGDPGGVRVEQPRASNGDIVICALWQTDATCDESGIHTPYNNRDRRNCSGSYRGDCHNNNNDVSVHFVVRVPDGIRVDVSTVNGALELNDVHNDIKASTVNGSIEAHGMRGPAHVETVNGSINIALDGPGNNDVLEYGTVNGSVTLALPSSFGAQLEMSTVNGRVTTDFPMTIVGTFSPRTLRGTIGSGAMRVRATTVNGSVSLRRAD